MRPTNSRYRSSGQAAAATGSLPATGQITAVLPRGRAGRVSIQVDGETVLELDGPLAEACGLRVGCTVDRATLEAAREQDLGRAARAYAVGLLALRAHSSAEVSQKLTRRGYPAHLVGTTLDFLTAQGWLNDREFARQYVRGHNQGRAARGERRLAQELRRKGLDADLIRGVLAEHFGAVDTVAQASALAQARLASLAGADRRTQYRRLGGFLARRGFDGETIARALRQVLAGTAEGEW